MTRFEAEKELQAKFGIKQFYDEQWNAISKLLNGERILMIQRTGFGKSLCYQFPATLFDGITVVFSPLIALMRDQVRSLKQRNISAAYINSEQTEEENNEVIQQAINGEIKILYIAPERQNNNHWIESTRQMKLSMIVIDEAHTISTWGHDFRPSFRRIINLVKLLPSKLPLLATTATATKRVQKDIEEQIGGKLTTLRGSLVRENFNLHVIRVKSEDEKMIWLAQNLPHIPGNGIIYTGTRVNTEVYSKWLEFIGINSINYNAGLDSDSRKDIEKGLLDNKWKCIVSTNALGMGIDKPDIRFVIHTQIPVSPIHYYQEIGRAGRDGRLTQVILFYNDNIAMGDEQEEDRKLPTSFIEGAKPPKIVYERVIRIIKNSDEPLSETALLKKSNIKKGQLRTIKEDLLDQGIIQEVVYGRSKKLEYRYNAPSINFNDFEKQREDKLKELETMIDYVKTDKPRMKFLCDFLDNESIVQPCNCDNTTLPKITYQDDPFLRNQLTEFRETYFPELETSVSSTGYIQTENGKVSISIKCPYPDTIAITKSKELIGVFPLPIKKIPSLNTQETEKLQSIIKNHNDKSHITNGYAASYYGVSNVGTAIHRCKYEQGGDFPDFLIRLMLKTYHRKLSKYNYNLIIFVPPTHSGNLVKHLAEKFSNATNIPLSYSLKKTRITEEQKIFQNSATKAENVAGAFDISDNVRGKRILLIDDIYDSGATMKEIGLMLTTKGAEYVTPIVLAKTVGGTPE